MKDVIKIPLWFVPGRVLGKLVCLLSAVQLLRVIPAREATLGCGLRAGVVASTPASAQ